MKEKADNKSGIIKTLRNNDFFLITAHDNPCGDAIGSELAMKLLLERLGKKAVIKNTSPVPSNLLFLPGAGEILHGSGLKEIPEVAVVVDCANLNRIGAFSDSVGNFDVIINIDHHISNDYFGTFNYVDTEAASTGEIIYRLFREIAGELEKDEATCLYVSIIADTGSFQHTGTKPQTHEAAAYLLSRGIDPSFVAKEVFGNFSAANRRLLGLSLSGLKLKANGRIALISVTREMFRKTGAQEEDCRDFIDSIHYMKGAQVSILLRELDGKNVKVSLRSNFVDVNEIAQLFGGGGHCRAAGCIVKGTVENAEKRILEAVESFLDRKEMLTKVA